MKSLFALSLLSCAAAWAQAMPPKPAEPEPEAVMAVLDDGYKLTYGELKNLMAILPPAMQQSAHRDRKAFVKQFALMRKLSKLAEEEKLDQESPTREALQFNRMYVMTNAAINNAVKLLEVKPEELQKFYEGNRDRFSQVKVKVIYVSFAANPSAAAPEGKKYLSEAEAKAKIEKLRDEIKKGADFVKLVKEHSEDQASAAKDGDFGTIRRSDNLPEAIRNAVFALKAGEISEPVRQPNGFYLFRADDVSVRPFTQVRDEIFNEVKNLQFKSWMDQTEKSVVVKYVDEGFFNAPPPPAPAK